jgi:hypothetical protein
MKQTEAVQGADGSPLYGEGLARVLRILDAATVLKPMVWDALVQAVEIKETS